MLQNINHHTNVIFMNIQGILDLFLTLKICTIWCLLYERSKVDLVKDRKGVISLKKRCAYY